MNQLGGSRGQDLESCTYREYVMGLAKRRVVDQLGG
jgi:hypothetical protein